MSDPQPAIIVTGATGFIGAAVVQSLVARGENVFALMRTHSDTTRLQTAGAHRQLIVERFDDAELAKHLRENLASVFIHCAWRGVAGKDRNEAWQITDNLRLTVEAAHLAVDSGCKQFIGLGSQAEYGNLNCVIAETAPTNPTTVYGKAKVAARLAALDICDAGGVAAAWLRVFSTYGPGDAPHWLISYIIAELAAGRAPKLTRCEQLWDYLHVTDAAEAVAALADGKASGTFNLGHGRAWSLREVVEAICSAMATSIQPEYGAIPYRPDQVMHLEADIAKLTAATGWRPRIGLAEGIAETVSYFRQHT